MNVIVFGANGQLGRTFQYLENDYRDEFQFHFYSSNVADISNVERLKQLKSDIVPDVVINCAAYTKVDLAETEVDLAYLVNVDGVRNLAQVFQESMIVHYSTDYVYHNECAMPLKESDPLDPKGIYAKSKLLGEIELAKYADNYLIMRTSWVYSPFGQNFVKTMLRLGKDNTELKIVNDQIGCPTYTFDIVKASMELIKYHYNREEKRTTEVYNFANEGTISWYDFAKVIFRFADVNIKLIPISSAEFNLIAPRPEWSKLNLQKVKNVLDTKIPHWLESINHCLSHIKANA